MPQVVKITINSQCQTVPPKATLHVKDQVQWHCGANGSYEVRLPGGVFEGHSAPFALTIDGPDFKPDPPLTAMTLHEIRNYVYVNGVNCLPMVLDDPPTIMIES